VIATTSGDSPADRSETKVAVRADEVFVKQRLVEVGALGR
jgi:hypothetical protein